ncbi:MAG: hypothetical protein M0R46_16255 [Candidatus Muirbacterium halophilum]|nr:hypothetical protein [Candidatus Muirbacterium halophilum]MCK9477470.1 hypothetical protein [Candidatus Muirbacterium halophilum]
MNIDKMLDNQSKQLKIMESNLEKITYHRNQIKQSKDLQTKLIHKTKAKYFGLKMEKELDQYDGKKNLPTNKELFEKSKKIVLEHYNKRFWNF